MKFQNLLQVLFYAVCSSTLLFFSPAGAQEWAFLPIRPLFAPLIADPREPHMSATAYLTQTQWEGAVGETFEFLRFTPPGGGEWGWGLLASGFIWLDEQGATFPMRDSDWYLGTYFSHHPTGSPWSFRLDYTHVSSHLGDALAETQQRIIYTRESFRLTASCQVFPDLRVYGGGGWSGHIAPSEPSLFFHGGLEGYSAPFDFLQTEVRGYLGYDLKIKEEAGGAVNHALQLGLQWKPRGGNGQDVRLAVTYFNGNDEWGQFYQQKDEHLGLGIYFDP